MVIISQKRLNIISYVFYCQKPTSLYKYEQRIKNIIIIFYSGHKNGGRTINNQCVIGQPAAFVRDDASQELRQLFINYCADEWINKYICMPCVYVSVFIWTLIVYRNW